MSEWNDAIREAAEHLREEAGLCRDHRRDVTAEAFDAAADSISVLLREPEEGVTGPECDCGDPLPDVPSWVLVGSTIRCETCFRVYLVDVDDVDLDGMRTLTEVRACDVCGCTDDNCIGCIDLLGKPCEWVGPNLCSACAAADELAAGAAEEGES